MLVLCVLPPALLLMVLRLRVAVVVAVAIGAYDVTAVVGAGDVAIEVVCAFAVYVDIAVAVDHAVGVVAMKQG